MASTRFIASLLQYPSVVALVTNDSLAPLDFAVTSQQPAVSLDNLGHGGMVGSCHRATSRLAGSGGS